MDQSFRKGTRSSQMIKLLKEHLLYSEKKPRDFLFDAIESLIRDPRYSHSPLIVARLIREASQRAREAAHAAGFEFRTWNTTAVAVMNAMLGAGVLRTRAGEPISAGIKAHATEVLDICANFRDLTEAFLIEALIRRLGDVTTRDHIALAHALFRRFDTSIPLSDLEDRVVLLLASLAGRIELTLEGAYREVRSSGSAPP